MFNTFIFLPLYNGLVGIMDLLPGIDVGIAVIIFTIIVRLILFPLSKSSLLTQVRMKEVEPEANRIKQEYANDKQTQALKVMELYKVNKIRPFSGVLLLFIQLHPEYLYSFVHAPVIKPSLLGLDLTGKSLILAVLTGVVQFFQLHFSVAARQQKASAQLTLKNGGKLDTPSQFANSMNSQMKFLLPIIAFVSVYFIIPARSGGFDHRSLLVSELPFHPSSGALYTKEASWIEDRSQDTLMSASSYS